MIKKCTHTHIRECVSYITGNNNKVNNTFSYEGYNHEKNIATAAAAACWVELKSSVCECVCVSEYVWSMASAESLSHSVFLSLIISLYLVLAVRRVSAWLVVLNVCSRLSSNNISFNSRYNKNSNNDSEYNNGSSCQHHHPPTHLIHAALAAHCVVVVVKSRVREWAHMHVYICVCVCEHCCWSCWAAAAAAVVVGSLGCLSLLRNRSKLENAFLGISYLFWAQRITQRRHQ